MKKNLTTGEVIAILKKEGRADREKINNLEELHMENLNNRDIPVYWDNEERFLILDNFKN